MPTRLFFRFVLEHPRVVSVPNRRLGVFSEAQARMQEQQQTQPPDVSVFCEWADVPRTLFHNEFYHSVFKCATSSLQLLTTVIPTPSLLSATLAPLVRQVDRQPNSAAIVASHLCLKKKAISEFQRQTLEIPISCQWPGFLGPLSFGANENSSSHFCVFVFLKIIYY